MNWETRILHLGLGRFHRGHQCVYYQKMKDLGDPRWGVVSMSMRSSEARDQLHKVRLRYPVLELSASGGETTWVESIREALSAPDEREKVLEVFRRPELEIISLTITEKGYDLNAEGALDISRASIVQDLSHPERPLSAIGILAKGLCDRFEAKLSPVTVISCDNLRDNGRKLKGAIDTYLAQLGREEERVWIAQKIKFPNTMVDRIVPSLLPEKITALEKEFSLPLQSELIGTEEFSQWVIEDDFALPRPQWEKVGVQFVKDVRPFEEMKLKLLNASHSLLAYAGLNRGYQFVHEAVANGELRDRVTGLYQEVTPLLSVPAGYDVQSYQQSLLRRFDNNKLPHQLKQIAMDGSQKLQQRIYPSLLEALKLGLSCDHIAGAVKEWTRFCESAVKNGKLPEDPESQLLGEIFRERDWRHALWESRLMTPLHGQEKLRGIIF